jgi:uncharacterized phage protein (TIGR02218 family)
MRTPSWEASAGALAALLNSSQVLAMADLYTFTLLDGAVLRYTSADVPVPVNGITWGLGPIIKRARTQISIGINVDELDVNLSADASVQVAGKPLMAFIANGGLNGARLKLERAFRANWVSPVVGTLILFTGRVSQVGMGRYEARIGVRSDTELLDVKVPKNLYQPGCMNTLYDGTCGLSQASLTVSNAVTASPAPTVSFFDSTLGQASGYFELGVVTFTSGANAGLSRTVKTHTTGGRITTIAPFPAAPAVGDTFNISPGCDKTVSRCTALGNVIRFRGQPFVPVPETVT